MRTNNGQILYIPKIGQRADFQHPLMKGCLGWWPLTDGAGGIAKDLMRRNDGVQSGDVTWADTKKGRAASFDGFDDRFVVDDAGDFDFGTGDFSVSAWVYYDTIATSFTQVFTRGDTAIGTACWFGIYKNSSTHKFIFDVDDNISKITTTSSVTATSGLWFHVAGVRNSGGTNVIYINGVSTGTASDSGNSISQTGASNQEFRIGCQRIGGIYQEFHDGNIQNVRIWDRALSSSEVFELYINPWSGLSMPSETRYFFVPQLITASPKLFSISGSSVSMRSNAGRVSVRAAR